MLRIRTCGELCLHSKHTVSVHCFIKHRVRFMINHQLHTKGICTVQNNWTSSLLHVNFPSFHAQSTEHKHLKKGTVLIMPVPVAVRSKAARPLRLWVWIPPGAWMVVFCECCVLSGRGLCDGLITRPEESYRPWRIVVCDQETLKMRRLKPATELWKNTTKGL